MNERTAPNSGSEQTQAMNTYSIGQLAKLSGVTERTLRHYETKGLLTPAREENGYRAYSPADVTRLQHILLFRACGIDLATIKRTLDGSGADVKAALTSQIETLEARRDELGILIENARAALAEQEGRQLMKDANRFEALKRTALEENERTYGAEVRARYGNDAMDASNAKLQAMDEREWKDLEELGRAILDQLGAAMRTGDPESPASARLAQMYAAWIRGYWGEGAYTPEAHRALAAGYVNDARFRAYYDERVGDGAAAFLAKALCAHVK